MEERRERGLKKLTDGRWQWSYQDPNGGYHRHIARTKGEARAYLEKVHTEIREGRYLDRRKEVKAIFEEAVKKFLEWSEASTRPGSYANDKLNAPLWLASPHFKGKRLDKITAGDVEQFRLERLKDVDRRGPSLPGLMLLAGRRYKEKTGKTLKHINRREVRSVLSNLIADYSGAEIKSALEAYFNGPSQSDIGRLRAELSRFPRKGFSLANQAMSDQTDGG